MPRSPMTALSHRFTSPAEPFSVRTSDGVRLVGSRLGHADPAVVFCHGFMGWHRKPRVGLFVEELSRWFTVFAFDMRGHGRSGGLCTFGDAEVLIVHGRDDHYFDEDEAWRLYRRAEEPKRLLLASRFGHAEDGFTPMFAERLARMLYQTWGLNWPG